MSAEACVACAAPSGTSDDCPECQVSAAEALDAVCRVGALVTVCLPVDVSPWFDGGEVGASWDAEVVAVNGDQLDVTTPTGDVEPVPAECCSLRDPWPQVGAWMVGEAGWPGRGGPA